MTTSVRRRTRAMVILGVVVAVLSLGMAAPAYATPLNITLTAEPPTSPYGQGWDVHAVVDGALGCAGDCYYTVQATVDGYTKNLGKIPYYPEIGMDIYDFNFAPQKLFGAGTHSMSVRFLISASVVAQSTTPVQFTLTKAPLLATTTITADPNNDHNAIVTSALTGDFVEQLPNCECEGEGMYPLPAGTWKLTITDARGATVFSNSYAQPANGYPTLVSYWQSVPPGETFSAQSTFTMASVSAANFTQTSQAFSWTTAGKSTTGGQPQGSHPSKTSVVQRAGFTLPLSAYWAALIVALILVGLDTVLLLRKRRRVAVAPVAAEREAGT